ncbi:hypothetical protein ABW20_dc0106684 [Dactylellina cionopaga]|nr:hypothetical protein ABW20_dc0106684 [Dactylellina cionopaga]
MAAEFEAHVKGDLTSKTEHGQYNAEWPMYHETMALAEFRNTRFGETADFTAVVQKTESLSLEGPKHKPHSENQIRSVYSNSSGNGHRPIVPPKINPTHGRPNKSDKLRSSSNSIQESLRRTPPVRRETNATPTTADEVHLSDSDEDIELEKLEFAVKRANKYYEEQDWPRTEKYIKAILKMSAKRGLYSISTTGGTAPEKIYWIYYLIHAQHNQEKFEDALGTIQSFENELKDGGPAWSNVNFENWQALLYYRLGDLGAAKRSCKKALKYGRGDTTYPDLRRKTVELMIHIVRYQGNEMELEFYKAMLVVKNESTAGAQNNEPTKGDESPRNKQVDTRSSFADVSSAVVQESEPGFREGLQQAKAKRLVAWGLTLLRDGSISGTDAQIDAAVKHAVREDQTGPSHLAGILFADERILNWNSQREGDALDHLPPLPEAVSISNVPMVKFLLNQGAEIYYAARPRINNVELAITADIKDASILNLLLNNGCSPDGTEETNKYFYPPLHSACINHSRDPDQKKLNALLRAGADPNKVSLYGLQPKTALMYGTLSRLIFKWDLNGVIVDARYSAIVKALVEAGADVNAVDVYGNSALSYASLKQDGFAIATLRSYGALERRNREGRLLPD